MSLNNYMHKRNPFKDRKIDFKSLASKYEFLKKAISSGDSNTEMVVDFKSPVQLSAISRALLMDTFGLDVFMPLDRLIPTIPLRMNYILWIEDLIQNIKNGKSLQPENRDVQIVDIGAGASCIYGLLGAHLNKWHFIATEIDQDNYAMAQSNVSRNKLDALIEVISVDNQSSLLGAVLCRADCVFIDVVICNPPFFANSADKSGGLRTRNIDARDEAKSVNTSNRSESLVEGGEVQFVNRLISESLECSDRVGVFTAMLGRKSSVDLIRHRLHSLNIDNHSVYEMCQGRVMRWGVAWSFLPATAFDHPCSEFRLHRQATAHSRCSLSWRVPPPQSHDNSGSGGGGSEYSVNGVYETLRAVCQRLDLSYLEQRNRQKDGGGYHLLLTAAKDTWSHQRRRRREMARLANQHAEHRADDDEEPDAKRRRVEAAVCEEAAALDTDGGSSSAQTDECLLRCTVNVATEFEAGLPVLKVQMTYKDGEKEAMNQILTYIKNYFQKPPL